MEARRFLLLLSLAVVVLAAIAVWFYPSSEDFRAENPFWNGLDTFNAEFPVRPLGSLEGLPLSPQGTTLIVIPYLPFTEPELVRLKDYLLQGGTLLLLDDYGYGNEVLEYLGLKFRFSGRPLLDPLFNYKNMWFPRIVDLAGDQGSLVLNHASSLSNAAEVEVIAWSSRFSFLDADNNGEWDEGEPRGPLPIAAQLKIGKGFLVAVADPSMIINSMIGMEDNRSFIQNCIQVQGSSPEIMVDQSRLPETPLDEAKERLAASRKGLSSFWGILGAIAVVLIVTLRPVWRRKHYM